MKIQTKTDTETEIEIDRNTKIETQKLFLKPQKGQFEISYNIRPIIFLCQNFSITSKLKK